MTERGTVGRPPDAFEAASAWFARARSGELTPKAREELAAWLEAAPEHLDAWRRVGAAWTEVEPLRSHPDVLALRERALQRSGRAKAWRTWFAPALAAGLAGAVVLLGLTISNPPGRAPAVERAGLQTAAFRTGIGERSSVVLADRSVAMLDADSAIRVRFSAGERSVELIRGRALFQVAKNPARPFRVTAGAARVTALGTEFTVDQKRQATTVALLDGQVRVEKIQEPRAKGEPRRAVDMAPGDQLTAAQTAWTMRRTDPQSALAWTRGQLVFEDVRLGDILEEANRYSTQKIVLADPRLQERRLTAVLHAGDTETLLNGIRMLKLAKVARDAAGTVTLTAGGP